MTGRRGATPHEVGAAVVASTSLEHASRTYRLVAEGDTLVVRNGESLSVGRWAEPSSGGVRVRLTPGAQTYYEARSHHGRAVSDRELVAAVIVAALAGHPSSADAARGTELSAVWSHHLAIACRDDPRRVAETYAPSETKTIAGPLQHISAVGVRVLADS